MKKLLSIVLCLVLIFCTLPVFAITASAAETEYTEGYYTYTVSNDEVTITDCDPGVSGDITIPSKLGGYPVTNIGNAAFCERASLTSIIIPDSVTSIGYGAFYNCTSLTSITIPDSVTSIDDYAFGYCSSLTSITIPDSVISIGWYAFEDCTSLASVSITDIAAWCNIGFENYRANPLYYAKNLYLNGELVTDLVIPDSVTSIGYSAFYNCSSLTSITIPDSVTSIGERAFYNCYNLTSITIPDSVTSIGDDAFYNCTSLTSVTIPDSVTIGDWAFYDCSSLTTITIPDSVISIGNGAFSGTAYFDDNSNWQNGTLYIGNHLIIYNGNKTQYIIKNGTKAIAGSAFAGCSSLTSITIPDSVTSIGKYAFIDCASLTDVYYRGSITDKNNISINSTNTDLTNATWHYNSCIGAADHVYDGDYDTDCNECGAVREITYTGWAPDGENWLYYINGVKATGWQYIGYSWYYFNESGIMLTGWQNIGNFRYYFADGGAMLTGWQNINGATYYFNTGGNMQTHWLTLEGVRYYFGADGVMQTGWVTVDDTKYLFDQKGKCVEGAHSFVIDVSRFQGEIDWDKVMQSGVDAVILRSSSAGLTLENYANAKDKKFDQYVESLNQLGVPYGIYHYNTAETVELAQIQANIVVKILKEAGADPTLPVFVDIESNGGKCDLVAIAKVYMSVFISNGYKPGIYANENYWNNYLNAPELNAYYKWIASYGENDGKPSASFAQKDELESYVIWQYTSKGELPGIDENTVDFNALFDRYVKTDGWVSLAGNRYYYSDGHLACGWLWENNNWYYFNSFGEMSTGWLLLGNTWYYLADNGVMVTGWQYINNTWYYFNAGGNMATGWLNLGGTWYYLAEGGNMVTGWQNIDGTWYYFNAGGNMATGWLNLGGTWYYLAEGGNMVTGWQNIGGTWYYFHAGGNMATGWLNLGGTWYYLAEGGNMLTGWHLLGGTWYYFNEGGAWVA